MGRRAKADPPVKLSIFLPQSIFVELKLRLYDPVTRRARYGGLSGLSEQLFRAWLERETQKERECTEQPTPSTGQLS